MEEFHLAIPLSFLPWSGHATASINPTYVPGTASVFQKRRGLSNSSNDTLKRSQNEGWRLSAPERPTPFRFSPSSSRLSRLWLGKSSLVMPRPQLRSSFSARRWHSGTGWNLPRRLDDGPPLHSPFVQTDRCPRKTQKKTKK